MDGVKVVAAGLAAAFGLIALQVWQANNNTAQNMIQPGPKVEPLQAGAAPNTVNGGPDAAASPGASVAPVSGANTSGCQPQGGWSSLGNPSYVSAGQANIDTDGDPNYENTDTSWNPNTSSGYSSGNYPGVVLTRQMYDDGVRKGDLAQVTNNSTGQSTLGVVYDANYDSNNTAYRDNQEISDYLAGQVGIQLQSNGDTVGSNPITIQAYAGSANSSINCDQSSNSSAYTTSATDTGN